MSRFSRPIEDGSNWPVPERVSELEQKLRYGEPSRSDMLCAAEVCASYLHLLTHPTGTERAIQKLRLLRRSSTAEAKDPS